MRLKEMSSYTKVRNAEVFEQLVKELREGFEIGNLEVQENDQISRHGNNVIIVGKELIFRWVEE
jgi:hypothetical protein